MKPDCFVPDCEKCPFKWSCKSWTEPEVEDWTTVFIDDGHTEFIDYYRGGIYKGTLYTPEDYVDVYNKAIT